MKGKSTKSLVVSVILAGALMAIQASQTDAKGDATCKSLRIRYPFGIAVSFRARGASKAFIMEKLYLQHQLLDRDFDGVVCEIESLQKSPAVLPSTTSLPATTTTVPSCANGGPCKVGDLGPGGGTIFHDSKFDNVWGRYLEIAPASGWANSRDPVGPFGCFGQWIDNGAVPFRRNTLDDIGTGKQNSIAILSSCKEANIGAQLAASFVSGGKDDWFLPSRNEQVALFANRNVVPGSLEGLYLSSTEESSERAYVFNYQTGVGYLVWRYGSYLIRPIRYVRCSIACK